MENVIPQKIHPLYQSILPATKKLIIAMRQNIVIFAIILPIGILLFSSIIRSPRKFKIILTRQFARPANKSFLIKFMIEIPLKLIYNFLTFLYFDISTIKLLFHSCARPCAPTLKNHYKFIVLLKSAQL